MSAVNITNVTVLDNPAPFLNAFQFEISYECLIPLKDGIIFVINRFVYMYFDLYVFNHQFDFK